MSEDGGALVREAKELREAIRDRDLMVYIDEDDEARHLFGHTMPALCDEVERLRTMVGTYEFTTERGEDT